MIRFSATTAFLSAFIILFLSVANATAETPDTVSPDTISSMGSAAVADYRRYRAAKGNKAFVIAPGGVWAAKDGARTVEKAIAGALLLCRPLSRVNCVPYDVNGKIIFDKRQWSVLWGPYKTRAEVSALRVGGGIGMRFPNLAVTTPGGRETSIAKLGGRVVIVHFWGSWCLPCLIEMPNVQKLYDKIKNDPFIELVMLQIREPIENSRRWMKRSVYKIPLYDSGISGKTGDFRLAGGEDYAEGDIVRVYPTTYVLDRNGVVIFSLGGPAAGWTPIIPFLLDAAERSGK